MSDPHFKTNDNPGLAGLTKDDVISKYEFTSEQFVIDICNENKEVAKIGPHTGKATGKVPRRYNVDGKDVPQKFDLNNP